MLSHGIVSSALFLCVGVRYDQHHTRLLKYYGGVAHAIPIYVTLFRVFTAFFNHFSSCESLMYRM